MFESLYEKLPSNEQRQFVDVVNNLFFHCFINRRTYDRIRKMNKINADYLFIEKYADLINEYLNYAGFSVEIDDNDGVASLTSLESKNALRLDGVTTILAYLLRYRYETEIANKPTISNVYMDSNMIKTLLNERGFIKLNKKFNMNTIGQSLKLLAQYNAVVKDENTFSDSYYSFYIVPCIRHVISQEKMDAIINDLDKAENEENNSVNEMMEEMNND